MNILLSQGMTRPGIVQGQHWGPSIVEAERIAAQYRGSWMPVPIGPPPRAPRDINVNVDVRFSATDYSPLRELGASLARRPTPRSHADPRLSNRMER